MRNQWGPEVRANSLIDTWTWDYLQYIDLYLLKRGAKQCILFQDTVTEAFIKDEIQGRFYFFLFLLVIWKDKPVIYFTQDHFMLLIF